MATGHPTAKKAALWRLVADGFSRRTPGLSHKCHGCLARFRRRAVRDLTRPAASPADTATTAPAPDSDAAVTRLAPRGQRWYMDFKDMPVPDIQGHTGFVLFVEAESLFTVVVLLPHATSWRFGAS